MLRLSEFHLASSMKVQTNKCCDQIFVVGSIIIRIQYRRFVARTYPPCWVFKARIQKHRGKPLLFHDKCPVFFYVHYTTHGTYGFTSHPNDETIMVKLKETSAATGQAGIRTHILTTPELEPNALDCSATTLIRFEALHGGISISFRFAVTPCVYLNYRLSLSEITVQGRTNVGSRKAIKIRRSLANPSFPQWMFNGEQVWLWPWNWSTNTNCW